MPFTVGGMASGMDTDAVISKLVTVEARPIQKLEIDKQQRRQKREALQGLKKTLETLNASAEKLYGFRAVYDDKIAASSDPSVVEVSASKLADKGVKKIEVIETASTHKISSDAVDGEEELPSGTIKIEAGGNSHAVRFRGGSLKKLQEKIAEDAADLVLTDYINTSGNNYVLTIESKIPGLKGEIILSGDDKLLSKTGLGGGAPAKDNSAFAISFDRRFFTSYSGHAETDAENGSLTVSPDGKKIALKGLLWREYALPVQADIKADTVLRFKSAYREQPQSSTLFPGRIEIGPVETVNIKGIELRGYNIARERADETKKEQKQFDSFFGLGLVYSSGTERREKLYPLDKISTGEVELKPGTELAGKQITRIIFYCNKGESEFQDMVFSTPVEIKDKVAVKNLINPPRNARLKVDGIELERDRNNDLNDIIKGATVVLKRASKEAIEVSIEPDIKKSVDSIKEFVEAYNAYLDFNNSLIKTERSDKPGQFREKQGKQGLFVGDMSLVRLENGLNRCVTSPYPSRAEQQIKLISDLGISTGALNSEWDKIKEGRLVIEEEILSRVIGDNPEGVKQFFGSDTDGDNRIDSGMAFAVETEIKPYIASGRSIINSKIEMENEGIRMADESIEKHEKHLKVYEEKLKRKFGNMERAISGSKSQQNWMNMQKQNMPDNNKNR